MTFSLPWSSSAKTCGKYNWKSR